MNEPQESCIGIGPQHVPCPRRMRCERHWALRRGGFDVAMRSWYLCQTAEHERFEEVRHAPV